MKKGYLTEMVSKIRLDEREQLPKDILDKEGVKLPEDDLEEISTTAGVPGYATPYAFGKADDDTIEAMGYKKVKRKGSANESQFMKLSKELHLNEVTYKDYKNDQTMSQKQKVNYAVHEVSKKMYEIERIVARNLKLKQETKVNNSEFWKSTQVKMHKISERLIRIAGKLKELNA